MEVVQFVHEGLGNSSYLVRLQEGVAALIDPDRSVGRYLRAAADRGWEVTAVFETHLHADFVSGAVEAASATGARVFLPEDAHACFPHEPLRPGLRLRLPGIEVEPVASPGHTPEHLSYAFYTEGRPPPFSVAAPSSSAAPPARTSSRPTRRTRSPAPSSTP